jgi:hypothetical protein
MHVKCIKNLVVKPEGKDHLKDLGVDSRRIVLEWVLRGTGWD